MKALRTAVLELWGLFVEDLSLTVATLACVALAALVIPRAVPAAWRGPALFAIVALVLVENVVRSARK